MNDVVAPVWNGIDFKAEAHRDPWSVPLDEIDVSNPYLYSEDTWHGFFARLRGDDRSGWTRPLTRRSLPSRIV